MKRILTTLVTVLLLTVALSVTASASDFDGVAEELSTIGMFRGTGSGFELDRAPTRSEAAIMLVRLYGAEEKAKTAYDAGEITHPFTDVGPIASPSVAWLYTNGITNGTTATTFGSSGKCSAKMYTTFLLRALGYQDPADFTYDGSLTFAEEKGFYWSLLFPGEFLRDDLAALTYQALAADMKGGSGCLLESLVRSGAIAKDAAAPIQAKIDAYRAMTKATAGLDQTAMDMTLSGTMNMTMTADGETVKIPTAMDGRMQVIAKDPADTQMAYVISTKLEGLGDTDVSMWMKDGWVYMAMTYEGETTRMKYRMDEVVDMSQLGIMDVSGMDVRGLAMLEDISVRKSGTDTVYTVTFRKGLGGLMGAVNSLMGQEAEGMDMEIGAMTAVYTISRNGAMKSCSVVFSAGMTVEETLEDGTVDKAEVGYAYDMTMKVNATGSAVKISWPDFSKFVEVDPAALAA